MSTKNLKGERFEISIDDALYPAALRELVNPPETLYVIGDPAVLTLKSIAVIGARKATPYGLACAGRLTSLAALRHICIVSGGARGIDAAAHRAALSSDAPTVAVLAGGLDEYYPHEHAGLFQDIIDGGGAIVSEHPWCVSPAPFMFRARNRIVAALAGALLVCEAGLPSGTFHSCDCALALGRDVLAVPGSILAPSSRGSNELIAQGAIPIVGEACFDSYLDVF